MLATVLKGERARDITFAIIETFAKVRELKRELIELHKETDKAKQASKMKHFGEVFPAGKTDYECSALPLIRASASLRNGM